MESDKIKGDLLSYCEPTDSSVNMGNTLGKCLSNVNKYPNMQSFVKDLSKAAVIG